MATVVSCLKRAIVSVVIVFVAFVGSSEASVTTVAYYRLGDADPGAVTGTTGAAITGDSAGSNALNRTGNPIYGAPAPAPGGNGFSMTLDGTSYYQGPVAVSP